jgi:small-conductance mechanosensitive channel
MTEVKQAEQMTPIVHGARVMIILQMAFGLFLAAIMVVGVLTIPASGIVVQMLLSVMIIAIVGWLIFRWSSRRKWVRWSAVAFETLMLGGNLVASVVDSDFGWMTLVAGALLPLAIIVGLLTAAAARWFDR